MLNSAGRVSGRGGGGPLTDLMSAADCKVAGTLRTRPGWEPGLAHSPKRRVCLVSESYSLFSCLDVFPGLLPVVIVSPLYGQLTQSPLMAVSSYSSPLTWCLWGESLGEGQLPQAHSHNGA